ncbi:MAG: serine/threonine protein kinase [Candidatus Magasanikbacteria bacterium]|nr:serine/threonine protein kinase [Candidatus Magasanikbacteria bacterium]NCS72133.1 serine/threonine protein kinase [Candidatus Magasanikbacteria bacterium]
MFREGQRNPGQEFQIKPPKKESPGEKFQRETRETLEEMKKTAEIKRNLKGKSVPLEKVGEAIGEDTGEFNVDEVMADTESLWGASPDTKETTIDAKEATKETYAGDPRDSQNYVASAEAPNTGEFDAVDKKPTLKDSRYTLTKELGEGGLGTVYLSERRPYGKADTNDNVTQVAVKVIKANQLKWMSEAAQEDAKARFKREMHAQVEASQRSPFIVEILDAPEIEGEKDSMALVLEYFKEGDIESFMEKGKGLPEETVCSIAVQTALGLAEMHKKGILHRDLKPANMFVDTLSTVVNEDGKESIDPALRKEHIATGNIHIKIGDFGISTLTGDKKQQIEAAKDTQDAKNTLTQSDQVLSSKITQEGSIVGTVAYLSPEGALGESQGTDEDLYQLGTVLYELLSGKLPYEEGSIMKMVSQKMSKEKHVNDAMGRKEENMLHRIVNTLINPDPEKRKKMEWNGASFDLSSASAVARTITEYITNKQTPMVSSIESSAPTEESPVSPRQFPYLYVGGVRDFSAQ